MKIGSKSQSCENGIKKTDFCLFRSKWRKLYLQNPPTKINSNFKLMMIDIPSIVALIFPSQIDSPHIV